MIRRTFTRRDGSRFALTLEIDPDKLAESLARKMLSNRKTSASRCDGSIKAKIEDLPS